MKSHNRTCLLRCGTIIFTGSLLLLAQSICGLHSGAQTRKRPPTASGKRSKPSEDVSLIEHAINTICTDRIDDPQGSVPIDEMAAQAALPVTDPFVEAGRKRAERLLPMAKKLVPSALSHLAATYNLESLSRDWIVARAKSVNAITVEMEKHDNAAWSPSAPHVISFGTVLLAGLRSDEATLTVLAHELTHAINGTDQALRPLFMRVAARASQAGKLFVGEGMAAELACDMIGLRVLREYATRPSNGATLRQRLTRALGKDCVRINLADETHLSPRDTMQLLLTLDPEFTKAIIKVDEREHLKNKDRPKHRPTSMNTPHDVGPS
jgi:hypothetical protein